MIHQLSISVSPDDRTEHITTMTDLVQSTYYHNDSSAQY